MKPLNFYFFISLFADYYCLHYYLHYVSYKLLLFSLCLPSISYPTFCSLNFSHLFFRILSPLCNRTFLDLLRPLNPITLQWLNISILIHSLSNTQPPQNTFLPWSLTFVFSPKSYLILHHLCFCSGSHPWKENRCSSQPSEVCLTFFLKKRLRNKPKQTSSYHLQIPR